jgi:EmrB/QacA subfamily drug resistance transporter
MLAILLSAVFMQLLDTTITMVAIPSIQSDLDASFADVQLVVALYSLAFACVLITGGRLGDIYGRKRVFMIGMVGFTAASVMCGAASTTDFLVISRVVQGLFSGLMFPQVLSIIQVTFHGRERTKALSIYGASVGLALVLGPVLGGWLIDLDIAGSDWRSIFYVNLPIGLLALALGAVRLRESAAEDAARLDLFGTLLVSSGLFLLILPLIVGREHDWPAWTIAMMVASPVVLALFALHQKRLTHKSGGSPLVRTTLFGDRSFSIGLVIVVVFFAGIPSFFFALFLTLQTGFAYSPVAAGAVTLAFAVMIAAGSARSGAVVKRLGTLTLAVATAVLTLGMGGVVLTLQQVGSDLRGWQLMPALVVAGAGAGLFLAPCIGVIMAGIKSRDAGSASGVLSTAQQVGASVGIAVVGIVFASQLGSNAYRSVDATIPALRSELTAVGLSQPQADSVATGLRVCFKDKASQKDLTATPPSCTRLEQATGGSAAPAEVKAKVRAAVLDQALPEARKRDFSRTFQQTLVWQLGVFSLSFLLVLALPRVKVESTLPGGL